MIFFQSLKHGQVCLTPCWCGKAYGNGRFCLNHLPNPRQSCKAGSSVHHLGCWMGEVQHAWPWALALDREPVGGRGAID